MLQLFYHMLIMVIIIIYERCMFMIVSTFKHCMFKGIDISNSVGTIKVTDFSKAFDCVDHTLAIQKL